MKTKPWLLFLLLLILSYYSACFSIAGDTLLPGQSLSLSAGETILSQGRNFELGFFKPGSSLKSYLGIWYKRFSLIDVVWVANRENPFSDLPQSRLELSEDGNLLLFEGSSKKPFRLTNLTHPQSNSTEAVLRDDGNFVLRDKSNPSSIFWQSFNHPTDTWLPGAKLGIDNITGKSKQLISWKNSEDPAPGMFSFRLAVAPDGSSQYILEWNKSQSYWSTGVWNGTSFSLAPLDTSIAQWLNFGEPNDITSIDFLGPSTGFPCIVIDSYHSLFSYASVSAATNNFSAMNKLGEGGFGPEAATSMELP